MSDKRKGLAAIGQAICDVARLNVPPRDTLIHTTRVEQTKPTELARRLSAMDQQILREIMNEPLPSKSPSRERDGVRRDKTPCDTSLHVRPLEQTNPNSIDMLALTSRQLAAARWIVKGFNCVDVAAQVRVSRQTIHRWKRLPAFNAEVRRLHEMLVRETR